MQTLGAVSCPLLVGRDDLLDLVDRRLDEVVAGRGQFLLLAGEAGIGKSRFLGAISRKAEERGFATSWGAARPGADPYQLPRFTPWDRDRLRFLLRMGQNLLRPRTEADA